jgi:hypothetical protein
MRGEGDATDGSINDGREDGGRFGDGQLNTPSTRDSVE